MKIKEINELDAKALAEKLEAEVAKLDQLKLTHTISPLENPSQIEAARRHIDRLTTVLPQRDLKQ